MFIGALTEVRRRIERACVKTNRSAEGITIVAVTKAMSSEAISEAASFGLFDIGENKVKEAAVKYNKLSDELKGLKWHMIGHLQTNKVKEALRIFNLIQSVDSLRLACEIDKEAAKINKVQDILVEINVSGEKAKFGLSPLESGSVIEEMSQLKNINVKGLMVIAPVAVNPEDSRSYFRQLKQLSESIRWPALNRIPVLSMGMSGDFEVAVEEGANMIRLGRALFG